MVNIPILMVNINSTTCWLMIGYTNTVIIGYSLVDYWLYLLLLLDINPILLLVIPITWLYLLLDIPITMVTVVTMVTMVRYH